MATGKVVKVKLTAEEQIALLQKKIQQVKALDDRQKVRELSDVVRKSSAAETRKKILIGAFIQSHIADLKTLSVNKISFVDSLKRTDDRALFGLPPLPTTAAPAPAPAPARSRSPAPEPAPLVSDIDMPLTKATDEDEMKRLGAKFKDGAWYVPAGVDARPFMKWF
jgi:hypothetical protein